MLGLYVHIPFCVSKCKYCDFNSYKLNKQCKERYLIDLEKEMSIYKLELEKNNIEKEISSVFIGGGTPSILTASEIKSVLRNIYKNFNIRNDAEITIECNPGTLTIEKLKVMKENGINRLSMGLQAVQNHHLKSIGRVHSYEEFEKNYKEAVDIGFDNINIDLMYCLPNQTLDEWKESLEKITRLNPAHISAYSLILEEGTVLHEMYENDEFELIDEETDIELYSYTIKYLKEKGYSQYEISNYAKTNKECKHNILYWECDSYIGLGPGASGYLNGIRYSNVESLDEYHKRINKGHKPVDNEEKLSEKDKIEEKIFMGLRMNKGIEFKYFKNKFGMNFEEKYKKQIKLLLERELINIENGRMKLTQRGREISNSVFVEFM